MATGPSVNNVDVVSAMLMKAMGMGGGGGAGAGAAGGDADSPGYLKEIRDFIQVIHDNQKEAFQNKAYQVSLFGMEENLRKSLSDSIAGGPTESLATPLHEIRDAVNQLHADFNIFAKLPGFKIAATAAMAPRGGGGGGGTVAPGSGPLADLLSSLAKDVPKTSRADPVKELTDALGGGAFSARLIADMQIRFPDSDQFKASMNDLLDVTQKIGASGQEDLGTITESMGRGGEAARRTIAILKMVNEGQISLQDGMAALSQEITKANSQAEDALNNLNRLYSELGSWAAAATGGIISINLGLSKMGEAFKTIGTLSGSLFTQFSKGGASASTAMSTIADAAGRVGEGLEVGAEAFDAIRSTGVRSFDQINETLMSASSAVLTIGGNLGEWGKTLGEIQYDLRLSSGQVKAMVNTTARIQKTFSLTTQETQELLQASKEINKEMFKMGTSGAAVMTQITTTLAAMKSFKGTEAMGDIMKSMTSAENYFQASGEIQTLLLRATSTGMMSVNDMISGQMMKSVASQKRAIGAIGTTLEDTLTQVSGMDELSAQMAIKALTGLSGGTKELQQTILGVRAATTSAADKQAEMNKLLAEAQGGGSEIIIKAKWEAITGKAFDGPISNLKSAAGDFVTAAKAQEDAQRGTQFEDAMKSLADQVVMSQKGLGGDFRGSLNEMMRQQPEMFKGLNITDDMKPELILSLMQKQADAQKDISATAQKQLEQQRRDADPIMALKQAVMGPINKILSEIAKAMLWVTDLLGPQVLTWFGRIVVLLAAISAAVAGLAALGKINEVLGGLSTSLKGAGGIGGMVGGLWEQAQGSKTFLGQMLGTKEAASTGEKVTKSLPEILPKSPGETTKNIAAGVQESSEQLAGTAGTVKKAREGAGGFSTMVHDLVLGLRMIKTKDIYKVLQIAAALVPVAAAMALSIYMIKKATDGMDPVAFLAGIAGYGAIVYGFVQLSKVVKADDLYKSLDIIPPLFLLTAALIPLAGLLAIASSILKGFDAMAVVSGIAVIGIVGAAAYGLSLLKLDPGMLGKILPGMLVIGVVLLAIAGLGYILQLVNTAFSGIDGWELAANMMSLIPVILSTIALAAIFAGVGALISQLAYVAPFMLVGMLGLALILGAVALIAPAISAVSKSLSGFSGPAFAASMLGLAIGMTSLLIVAATLAGFSAVLLLLPAIAIGLYPVGILLLVVAGLGQALIAVTSALAGFDGMFFAKTMFGLGIGLASLLIVAAALAGAAALLFVLPTLGLGMIATTVFLGAVLLMAPVLQAASQALSGFQFGGLAESLWEMSKAILALFVLAGPLSLMLYVGLGALAGILVVWLMAEGVAQIVGPLALLSSSLSGLDLGGLLSGLLSLTAIVTGIVVLGTALALLWPFVLFMSGLLVVGGMAMSQLATGLAAVVAPIQQLQKITAQINPAASDAAANSILAVGRIFEAISEAGNAAGDAIEGFTGIGWIDSMIGSTPPLMQLVAGLDKIMSSGLVQKVETIGKKFGSVNMAALEDAGSAIKAVAAIFSAITEAAPAAKAATGGKGVMAALSRMIFTSPLDQLGASMDMLAKSNLAEPMSRVADAFYGVSKESMENVAAAFNAVGSIFGAINASAVTGEAATTSWWGDTQVESLATTLTALANSNLAGPLTQVAESFSGVDSEQMQKVADVFGALGNVFKAISETSSIDVTGGWFSSGALAPLAAVLDGMLNLQLGTKIQALINQMGNINTSPLQGMVDAVIALKNILQNILEMKGIADLVIKTGAISSVGTALQALAETKLLDNVSKIAASTATARPAAETATGTATAVAPGTPTATAEGSGLGVLVENSSLALEELRSIRNGIDALNAKNFNIDVGGGGKTDKPALNRAKDSNTDTGENRTVRKLYNS